jgi:hypothetical protein
MGAATKGYHIPAIAAHGAPLAKAGVIAAVGKGVLIGLPAALVGVGLGYALLKAFDVRWDEFSQRAADGESTMLPPYREQASHT